MKYFFALLLVCFAVRGAAAAELISLYAQGCLPYTEDGSVNFNCSATEIISIELKDSGSGVLTGVWSKTIQREKSTIVVSLEINKFTFSSGAVATLMTGEIKDGAGVALVTTSNSYSKDSAVSLASLTPYGERKAYPHFFFGAPSSFNQQTNAYLMKNSVLVAR